MTLYETLSFHSPFYNEKCAPKRDALVRKKKRPELHDKETRSPVLFQDLMAMCWSHEPKQRPGMSEVKILADKAEFELLRTASALRNTTERKACFSCACVSRTFPRALASNGGMGYSSERQIREAGERESLHNPSDPFTPVVKEEGTGASTNEVNSIHFSSNNCESLSELEPSTQIWVFEHVLTEHKPESKAAIYIYQDRSTGCYRRSAVSTNVMQNPRHVALVVPGLQAKTATLLAV